jgi:DNA-binding NtrC family response regulator
VRELRNLVRRALELCSSNAISAEDLGLLGALLRAPAASPSKQHADRGLSELSLEQARGRWNLNFEREYVETLLEKHGWDFERAARAAQVHVKTLQRMARKHQLIRR